jgi:ubiquinone/menaquinone biosynthesis C-methylase UbiE
VAARNLGVLHKKFLHRSKVLELGAGECFLSVALTRAGAGEVYALDAVPAQIWAVAMRNSSGSNMHFCLSDALDLPFQNASFDVVLSYCFLHHMEPLTTVFSLAKNHQRLNQAQHLSMISRCHIYLYRSISNSHR